jgi:hypothetical protein
MWSVSPRLGVLAGIVVLVGASVGCGSTADSGPWFTGDDSEDSGADSGQASSEDGGGTNTSDSSTSIDGGATTHDGSAPDTGTTGGQDASVSPDTGTNPAPDSGTVTSTDGFGAARTACINKINALRATDTAIALQPLTLENTDAMNSCVDTQSNTDQSMNSAHYSFINNAPACMWGNANGWAQDECEDGYGTTVAGIEQCLQDMWDESLKPNCRGCVGCTAFGGACANCDYSGSMGYECGHYVNMSAPYFTSVVCGFAGAAPSSSSGWSDQNFE